MSPSLKYLFFLLSTLPSLLHADTRKVDSPAKKTTAEIEQAVSQSNIQPSIEDELGPEEFWLHVTNGRIRMTAEACNSSQTLRNIRDNLETTERLIGHSIGDLFEVLKLAVAAQAEETFATLSQDQKISWLLQHINAIDAEYLNPENISELMICAEILKLDEQTVLYALARKAHQYISQNELHFISTNEAHAPVLQLSPKLMSEVALQGIVARQPLPHTQFLQALTYYPWKSISVLRDRGFMPVIENPEFGSYHLDLRNLHLETLCGLEHIPSIEIVTSLNISDNEVTNLSREIGYCKKLKQLIAQHNQLTEITFSRKRLADLQALDIRNNPISKLPSSIWQLPKLLVDERVIQLKTPEKMKENSSPNPTETKKRVSPRRYALADIDALQEQTMRSAKRARRLDFEAVSRDANNSNDEMEQG